MFFLTAFSLQLYFLHHFAPCDLPSSSFPSPPSLSLSLSHDRVLEAVTVNGEMCNINRFEPVLMALKKTNNPMLQLACLQFINAIVNTPEDIDFKIHLRNEFIRGGLDEMLMVSKTKPLMPLSKLCIYQPVAS